MKRSLEEEQPPPPLTLTLQRLRIRHYLDIFRVHLLTLIFTNWLNMDVIGLIQSMIVYLKCLDHNIDLSLSRIIHYPFTLDKNRRVLRYSKELRYLYCIVSDIACGKEHTILLTNRGLLGSGSNTYSQLGFTKYLRYATRIVDPEHPKFIDIGEDSKNILSIQCGSYFTAVLTINALYVFGANDDGQLNQPGLLTIVSKPTELIMRNNRGVKEKILSVVCGGAFMVILTPSGLFRYGKPIIPQLRPPTMILSPNWIKSKGIAKIACGDAHIMILTLTGEIYGYGENTHGQLGLHDHQIGLTLQKVHCTSIVKSIYCGFSHTMILTIDGDLYASGRNTNGELGLGDLDNRWEFTRVPIEKKVKEVHLSCVSQCSTIVTDDDNVFMSGSNSGTIPMKSCLFVHLT